MVAEKMLLKANLWRNERSVERLGAVNGRSVRSDGFAILPLGQIGDRCGQRSDHCYRSSWHEGVVKRGMVG